jgi:hypothetical protein
MRQKICCEQVQRNPVASATGLKARIRRVRFERLLFAAKVLCRPAAPI